VRSGGVPVAVGVGAGPVNHTRTTEPFRVICASSVPNDPGMTPSVVHGRPVWSASHPISERSRHAGPLAVTLTTWPGVASGEYHAQPSEAGPGAVITGSADELAADEHPAAASAITATPTHQRPR